VGTEEKLGTEEKQKVGTEEKLGTEGEKWEHMGIEG